MYMYTYIHTPYTRSAHVHVQRTCTCIERTSTVHYLAPIDGAMCEQSEPEARVHFLVLTDAEGHQSFATCLTYYSPFNISSVSIEHVHVCTYTTCVG